MKAHPTLAIVLLLISTGAGAALAQTPDWQTPSMESICDVEDGAAFGLCNAYCEAMDCETDNPSASATACAKVRDKFMNITGHDLPCENACPCEAMPEFNAALAGTATWCFDGGDTVFLQTTTGYLGATETFQPPDGGGCGVFSLDPWMLLSITPEEGAACNQLLRGYCPPQ